MVRSILFTLGGAALALIAGLYIGVGQYIGMGNIGIVSVIALGALAGLFVRTRKPAFLAALLVVLAGIGALWYFNTNAPNPTVADWETYRNERFGCRISCHSI